uniref:Uncharacterized protein n=1 Tax=Globodera rostochiensis TaxID=31243 RepID=A0A914HAK0_GLORO
MRRTVHEGASAAQAEKEAGKSGGQKPAIFESVQKKAAGDTKNDAERAEGGNGAVGSDDKLEDPATDDYGFGIDVELPAWW